MTNLLQNDAVSEAPAQSDASPQVEGVGPRAWGAPLPPPPQPGRPRRSTARAAFAGGIVGALVAGGVAYGTVRLTDHNTPPAVSIPAAPVPANPTPDRGATANQPSGQALDVHAVLGRVGPSVV